MAKAKGGFVDLNRDNTRIKTSQGLGRATKYSTRVSSKRFKKKYRGQGK